MILSQYEQTLLDGWEETYKKGHLTFWILFALFERGRHMNDIKDVICHLTNGTFTADDQSMYRSLRRLHGAGIIEYTMKPSDSGPDLKIYSLTRVGEHILHMFAERNIMDIYFSSKVMSRLHKLQERNMG